MNLENLLHQKENLGLLVVLLLMGILICFSGYRFLYLILGVSGFLVAFLSAILVFGAIPDISIEWVITIAIVFGMVGVGVSLFLFKSGIFMLGVIGGVSISIILMPIVDTPLAVILFGIIGGICGLIVEKPIIIFSTASLGGILIFWSAIHLAELLNWVRISSDFDPTYFHLISGLTWLGLTILGMAIQFRSAYAK